MEVINPIVVMEQEDILAIQAWIGLVNSGTTRPNDCGMEFQEFNNGVEVHRNYQIPAMVETERFRSYEKARVDLISYLCRKLVEEMGGSLRLVGQL